MKRAFLGLVAVSLLAFAASGAVCTPAPSKCDKAVDNIMAKCGTCFATSSSSSTSTSSRNSDSCRQALMNMCEPTTSSSSSSSSGSGSDAFLDCVANATSCDVILLCS